MNQESTLHDTAAPSLGSGGEIEGDGVLLGRCTAGHGGWPRAGLCMPLGHHVAVL